MNEITYKRINGNQYCVRVTDNKLVRKVTVTDGTELGDKLAATLIRGPSLRLFSEQEYLEKTIRRKLNEAVCNYENMQDREREMEERVEQSTEIVKRIHEQGST